MYFPRLGELATTHVIMIGIDRPFSEAVKVLLKSEHRSIVVLDGTQYRLLRVTDVLKHCDREANPREESTLRELELPLLPTMPHSSNILTVLETLHFDFEEIVVTDEEGKLYGIVTYTDIISSIDPETLMENFRLGDLVRLSKRTRWVRRDEPTLRLVEEAEKYGRLSAIIVENRKPIGIITAKDLLKLVVRKVDLQQPIERYMNSPVITVRSDRTIAYALQFMQDKHFNRIVIVDPQGEMVGVLTQKELVTLTYSRWIKLMKAYQEQLSDVNERLRERSAVYEQIAIRDTLTGTYNRMKFMELFVAEYEVMLRRRTPMSLIMVDLDHFKAINDRWGHNVGDRVLRQTARLLLHSLRGGDIVCRWGGEEFVILLPATDGEQTMRVAEHLRQALESYREDGLPSVTGSFGVTEVRRGDTLDEAIGRADRAMYEAKRAGRNCVRRVD